ncbi:MAG: aldo/keto reductase [Caldilineaceae bacterium]
MGSQRRNNSRLKDELGAKGIVDLPMGLGMAALGRPGYINLGHGDDLSDATTDEGYGVAEMQAHAFGVLDAAWRLGIRYFDVARSYGRAEEFLGMWLRDRDIVADDVMIASKWGYTYTAGWRVEAAHHEVKEHSLSVLQRHWSETAHTLGAYLTLYQIHSATFESGVLDNAAVLDELGRLKENGTAIGLTLSGANQGDVLARALDVELDGLPLFDAVQSTWNLLEPSAADALAQASRQGMVVIVKEALANGRLTPRNEAPEFSDRMAVLRDEAERLAASVDALALAAVLSQPWVDVVLSGAASKEQIASNLRALDVPWDEQAAIRLSALAELPDEYWRTRSELVWN